MSAINYEKTPTPHIDARPGEIAETILIPGDPLRAKYIADSFLTDVRQFNRTRNMLGFTGKCEGKPVSVMGSGMGAPSIGIYSYELINFYGVKNLIRVGTAGAMSPEVHVRELVFAMGACSTSNFPALFETQGTFAPIASFELLRKGVEAAEKRGLSCHVGNVLTSDMFYNPPIPPHGTSWGDLGVLAVEMETAALYSNAAFGGANALTILTVSDSELTGEVTTAEERQNSFTDMMRVALDIAISM